MNRIPSLDGFRGVAVLLVLFAHLFVGSAPRNQPFAPWTREWFEGGGLVGVQMFFVLSGYLITGILLREIEADGRLRLLRFYARRMRRLYPALVGLCVAYSFCGLLFDAPDITQQIAGALTYTSNIYALSPWGWLGHTWSLSVEEQFYLAWPLLLWVAWRVGGRRGVILATACIALATVALRHTSGMEPGDVDALLRWDALAVGCALAAIRPQPFRTQTALGALGFAILACYCVWPHAMPFDRYAVTAIASGAAMLGALCMTWLGHDVLRYFGRVSYSLYLWHMLILRFPLPGPVALALSLIAAELSYRYIERLFWRPEITTSPISHGNTPPSVSGSRYSTPC